MNQYKIVIVENDDDERFFLREELGKSDAFQLLGEFVNGDTLLAWFASKPDPLPTIILSDLNMPGKNGYDILSILTSDPMYAHIPIIITSTSPVISVREKCLAMGAVDYMIKPEIFTDYREYVATLTEKLEGLCH